MLIPPIHSPYHPHSACDAYMDNFMSCTQIMSMLFTRLSLILQTQTETIPARNARPYKRDPVLQDKTGLLTFSRKAVRWDQPQTRHLPPLIMSVVATAATSGSTHADTETAEAQLASHSGA